MGWGLGVEKLLENLKKTFSRCVTEISLKHCRVFNVNNFDNAICRFKF